MNNYDNEDEGRGRFDQTSSFSTTAISKDGRFLGIKLSQEMASQLRQFSPALLDWGRRQAERVTTPVAKKFAAKILNAAEHEANNFAAKSANVVGYGVILSRELFDIGSNVYESTQSLNALRQAVKPLSSSGRSVAPLSGDNEVVANARTKIKDVFWKRLVQTGTGAIATAPALYSKINEQSAKNKERLKQTEYERIKNDPAAYKEFVEKEIGLKVADIEGEVSSKALDSIIEAKRKEYKAKYAKFKVDNIGEVTLEFEKTFKLSNDELYDKMRSLGQRYNIQTYDLENALTPSAGKKPDLKGIKAEFEKRAKDRTKHLVDERLKTKFVGQNGAFDGEWEDYQSRHGRNERLTIKEQIEQKVAKYEEARLGKSEDGKRESSEGSDIGKMAAGLGAGLVAELFTNKLVGKQLEKYNKPIALDRILHLRRVLEEAKDQPPEQVPSLDGGNELSYTRYVHEIFQQHQRDLGRVEIGERYTENLEKAHWDDSAILQVADEQLNSYEYAVKTIAKRIKDGRMDAIALIDLVGDKNKKIVRSDGRSFGPLGVGKDEAVIKTATQKIIDEKTASVRVNRKQTEAEFNEKLGDFVFSIADIKQALESKTMDPSYQAFIFTVITEVLGSDEQIIKKIGIAKERTPELRKERDTQFTFKLDAGVKTMAEMLENNPDELKKLLKITEKEQQLILSMAEQVSEGKHVIDVAQNSDERKAIETAVANAAMVLDKGQDSKPDGFWQKLVTNTRALTKAKEEKPLDEKEAANTSDGFSSKEKKHDADLTRIKPESEHRHKHRKDSNSPEASQIL